MVAVSHALLETANIPKEFQPGLTGVAVGSHVRFGSIADVATAMPNVRLRDHGCTHYPGVKPCFIKMA